MPEADLVVTLNKKSIKPLMRAYFEGVAHVDIATACAIDKIIESLIEHAQNKGAIDALNKPNKKTNFVKLSELVEKSVCL